MVDETDSERHVKTKSKNFDPEKFYRICLRLRQYFCTAPAALAPVLIFPEVLVLIAVSFSFSFSAHCFNRIITAIWIFVFWSQCEPDSFNIFLTCGTEW